MTLPTFLGLVFVTGASTVLGSLPVVFHHYLGKSNWSWWESFGGGVMTGASIFSLLLPAMRMTQDLNQSYSSIIYGLIIGTFFILVTAGIVQKITQNALHQKAFIFVFVMALHNVPEGLAVGVDVAAIGWRESLPLTVAIFIQNLPEGLVSSMSFLLAGFSVRKSLAANGITAVVEALSAVIGFVSATQAEVSLPFMLSFAAACMLSVVLREAVSKMKRVEPAGFAPSGFIAGVALTALLDNVL